MLLYYLSFYFILILLFLVTRWLIEKTTQFGYSKLNREYEEDYRDNTRALVRAPILADQLYSRLKYDFIFII